MAQVRQDGQGCGHHLHTTANHTGLTTQAVGTSDSSLPGLPALCQTRCPYRGRCEEAAECLRSGPAAVAEAGGSFVCPSPLTHSPGGAPVEAPPLLPYLGSGLCPLLCPPQASPFHLWPIPSAPSSTHRPLSLLRVTLLQEGLPRTCPGPRPSPGSWGLGLQGSGPGGCVVT